MDLNQAARMIEWLDEERRRDKGTIAKLEERMSQQQDMIETLTRKLGAMENEQSGMRTQFIPVGRDNEMIDQVRLEIRQTVDELETRRIAADRENEKRAEVSRENLARPVRELGDRIDRLERAQDEISTARVERDRFAAALSGLQQRADDLAKKMDEPDRRLAFLEEQRRQDARRISETQTELPELQKQIDGLKPKLDLIEDMILRTEKKIIEVQTAERERRDQVQTFIEQQTLYVQQREQRVEELTRQFGQYDDDMRRNLDRFETWSEAYRQMKKVIEDFDRIGDRLERRINEVAEMQRLSEERFRQEWASWNADDQKRWKQFTLTNDESWRTHDKEFDTFRTRFGEAVANFTPIYDSLDRIWKLQRAQANLLRDQWNQLLGDHDQPLKELRGTNGRS
jgi:chromosome segregation ATPase